MSSPFLDSYDPLDIIGNGSFGIIRKVRRKADGMTFARKELNFERMSERDRKQIVAEVNILKDLHHGHIVRYIDRYVDRDAGILYILMEYCGGGDLSSVIKLAGKHNRPIPEDTIWNYFMQILLALHHCHHPNGQAHGHARSNSSGGSGGSSSNGSGGCGTGCAGAGSSGAVTDGGASCDGEGRDRRVQILHRDLKPDNVFLDENNTVKLGDFGLSKALAQASFANTYVGTPYYMSPELMQEKAYDSKSDIWSLGCLIYELCALKPPFHEAKTHAELSICIRNGRIPPLPRGYSQALSNVIKSMLSLNPAMRPSAAQLLQHERLELVFKVSETEKMLTAVKAHKAAVSHKERELFVREAALQEKERHLAALLARKDAELTSLQKHAAHIQQRAGVQRYTQQDVESAVARREEELRVAVMRREDEVKAAMTKREEEIAEAVKKREMEVCEAWARREVEITREVEIRIREVKRREEELNGEEVRLSTIREELEAKVAMWEDSVKARKEKTPLEEVKNLLTPLARIPRKAARERRPSLDATPKATRPISQTFPPIETPGSRAMFSDFAPSAMKGVVLTSTGEVLETPTPTEVAQIFKVTPKVGLNFARIFEFGADESKTLDISAVNLPPSPSWRKEKERNGRGGKSDVSSLASSSSSSNTAPSTASNAVSSSSAQAAAKTRRPSTGKGSTSASASAPASRRTSFTRAATVPVLGVSKKAKEEKESKDGPGSKRGRKSHSHSQPVGNGSQQRQREDHKQGEVSEPVARSKSAPQYDLEDEENLPSPFLKRAEVERDKVFCAFVDEEEEEDLPSPFLKRVERQIAVVATVKGGTRAKTGSAASGSVKDPTGGSSCAADATGSGAASGAGTVTTAKKRPSNGNMLRAMAAANNVAGRKGTTPVPGPSSPTRASAARAAQIQADSHQPHHHQNQAGRPVLARNVKGLLRS